MSFFTSIGELVNDQELNIHANKEESIIAQFRKIKVGDIIWAKRYANSYIESRIPEHHREGPFIVLEKTGKALVCVQGSSVEPKNKSKNFNLDNQYYSLKKETNFNFDRIILIYEYSFIKKVDKLTTEDRERLYKSIKRLNLKYKTKNGNKKFSLPAQVGDIIYYWGNKYIIVSIQNKQIVCVLLRNLGKNFELKDFKGVDYSNISVFLECAGYNILSSVDNKILNYVLKNYYECLKKAKTEMIPKRGSIVSINNKFYYIYGEDGLDWLLFEVQKFMQEDQSQICIQNTSYYTDFKNTITINKKELLSIVLQASEEEIKKIKSLRKGYLKSIKIEPKETEKINYKVGDIIQCKNYKNERFFVIKIYDNLFECLSINELKKGNYFAKFFKREDIKRAGNKSIQGIKWLEENDWFDLSDISRHNVLNEIIFVQKSYIDNELSNEGNTLSRSIKAGQE